MTVATLRACACDARATLEPFYPKWRPVFLCPKCGGVIILEFEGDALAELARYTAGVRLRIAHDFAIPDALRSREHAHYRHGFD